MSIIFIDTETTGLPKMANYKFPDYKILKAYDSARAIQISWVVMKQGQIISDANFLIKPDGFTEVTNSHIHGITYEKAEKEGHPIKEVLEFLKQDMWDVNRPDCDTKNGFATVVAHNIDFDLAILRSEIWRASDSKGLINMDLYIGTHPFYCTMKKATKPGERWPTLVALHTKYFGEKPKVSHDALADCYACLRCFWFQQMNTDINKTMLKEVSELNCY